VWIATISTINTDELQPITNAIDHELNMDGNGRKLRQIALWRFAPWRSIDIFPGALQGNPLSCFR
jgi:hypothetical protein